MDQLERPVYHPARAMVGEISWAVLQRVNGIHVSSESIQNVGIIDNHLREGKPALLYLNHIKFGDTPRMISFILAHFKNIRNLMAPVAVKYVDTNRNPATAEVLNLISYFGMQAFPVVQDKERDRYSDAKAKEMADSLQLAVRSSLADGPIIGWTPEGSRNPEAVLSRAKPGVGRFHDLYPEIDFSYVPAGLIYSGIHPGINHDEIIIGQPYKYADLNLDNRFLPENKRDRGQVVADAMMCRLAEILPKPMRGAYSLDHPR